MIKIAKPHFDSESKKEYLPPEIHVIELDMNAALLTMSITDTMILDVNNPSDKVDGGAALSPEELIDWDGFDI